MRILSCVDFSPISEAVISETASLARAAHAQVVLFHAAQTDPVLTSAGVGPPRGHRVPPEDLGERRARLDAMGAGLRAQGVDVRVELSLADKPPHEVVLELARIDPFTHIVMGSHGRSRTYDLLVGSVTQGVLRGARVPVIVVPHPRPE